MLRRYRLVWTLGLALVATCVLALYATRGVIQDAVRMTLVRSLQLHARYVDVVLRTSPDPEAEIQRFYQSFDDDPTFAWNQGGFLAFRIQGGRLASLAATRHVRHLITDAALPGLRTHLGASQSGPITTWTARNAHGVTYLVGQQRMTSAPVVVLQLVALSRIEGRLLSPFGAGLLAICTLLSLLIWSLSRTRLDLAESRMELLREQAHRAQVLDQLHAIVIVLAKDGAVLEWNQSAAQALGVTREQALGHALTELPIEWDHAAVRALLERVRASPTTQQADPIRIKRAGAHPTLLGFRLRSIPGTDESGVRALLVGEDITAKLHLEAELGHTQKLRSVGLLASGIAHEINTPAQFVGDNLRFVLDGVADLLSVIESQSTSLAAAGRPDPAKLIDVPYLAEEMPAALEQSLEGIARIAEIVGAMQRFAHPDSAPAGTVDVHAVLDTAIVVTRNEWKSVAQIERRYDRELPAVRAQQSELSHAFLQLILNACHAIADAKRERGLLRISTARVGDFVEIAFSDNGIGIPEELRSRVFEPLFTTRDPGQGVGQGLAIAHATIVGKHRGSIRFETEVGVGTTFTVRLRAAGDASA